MKLIAFQDIQDRRNPSPLTNWPIFCRKCFNIMAWCACPPRTAEEEAYIERALKAPIYTHGFKKLITCEQDLYNL